MQSLPLTGHVAMPVYMQLASLKFIHKWFSQKQFWLLCACLCTVAWRFGSRQLRETQCFALANQVRFASLEGRKRQLQGRSIFGKKITEVVEGLSCAWHRCRNKVRLDATCLDRAIFEKLPLDDPWCDAT